MNWFVALLLLGPAAFGYKIYQDEIPNGANIPHPCKSNFIWQGVGHRRSSGGGVRNPFGIAFDNAGKTWTSDLCAADSDQDGRTNGEELGDPTCSWTKSNNSPLNTSELSHPGICEPTTSADCLAKNAWTIDCSEGADFTCSGVNASDTVNVTLRLDRTAVPAQETTYICQSFTIPDDKVYHLFANKPEIDNDYVMHHTLLYGCDDSISGYDTPKSCDMGGNKCTTILGTWTVGLNGNCLVDASGILVGKGHFTKVLLEHHWNNPTKLNDQFDSSGMTIYLTPNLRPNNLGFLVTGQEALNIPPRLTKYSMEGTCPSTCTKRRLKDKIYITSAHVHMHYLGSSGHLEHWRNGEIIDTWFDETAYSYETPIVNEFNPGKEFRPGDAIRTVCVFDSSSRTELTVFGDATNNEMCYAFLTYYPAENGPSECVSYDDMDACEIADYDDATSLKDTLSLGARLVLAFVAFVVFN